VRELHQPAGQYPGVDLDAVLPGADRGILLLELARLFRIHVQDGEPPQLRSAQYGTGCEKLPGFVKVGEVSHVSILKLGLSFLVELWSVRAQKEERDRISIEFHTSSRTRLGRSLGRQGLPTDRVATRLVITSGML
jgi:hypothetical protein